MASGGTKSNILEVSTRDSSKVAVSVTKAADSSRDLPTMRKLLYLKDHATTHPYIHTRVNLYIYVCVHIVDTTSPFTYLLPCSRASMTSGGASSNRNSVDSKPFPRRRGKGSSSALSVCMMSRQANEHYHDASCSMQHQYVFSHQGLCFQLE